jgi:hypothetical protein
VDVQSSLSLVCLGEKDKPILAVSKFEIFSCSDTWNAIRKKYDSVDWFTLIWYPLAFSFGSRLQHLGVGEGFTS